MRFQLILTILAAIFASMGSGALLKKKPHKPLTAGRLFKDLVAIRDGIKSCEEYVPGWNNWSFVKIWSFSAKASDTNDRITKTTKDLPKLAPLTPEESKKAMDIFREVSDEGTKFVNAVCHNKAMHGYFASHIVDGLGGIKEKIGDFCVGLGAHLEGEDLKKQLADECEEMTKAAEEAKNSFKKR